MLSCLPLQLLRCLHKVLLTGDEVLSLVPTRKKQLVVHVLVRADVLAGSH